MCYNTAMYIEFVIADNFVLTFLAALTATRLLHKRSDVLRLIVASALGTLVAVFYPMMRLPFIAQLAVKAALWAGLSAVLFFKTPRPVMSALLFLGCTFAYGGACYALGLLLYSGTAEAYDFSKRCPLFLVLLTGAVVYAVGRAVIKRLCAVHARAPYEYRTEVEVFGKRLRFDAFLDTGNCVFDDATGLPVIITGCDRFTAKLDVDSAREFIKHVDGFRSITVRTHAGETKAYLIKPTRVTVYSADEPHKIDAMVGLVGGGFSAAHEMILNPAVVTEGI